MDSNKYLLHVFYICPTEQQFVHLYQLLIDYVLEDVDNSDTKVGYIIFPSRTMYIKPTKLVVGYMCTHVQCRI